MSVFVSVCLCPICYPLQLQHRYLIDFGGGFVYDKEKLSCFLRDIVCTASIINEYFFMGKSALKTNKFGHAKRKMRPAARAPSFVSAAYFLVRACARVSVCLCV